MYAKKAKIYLLMYTNHEKISYPISYPFNDFKQRQMVLTCSKKMSALLRGITSKYHGNFFFISIVFILLQQKTNVNLIKKVCENKDFCYVIMPFKYVKY